MHRKAPKPNSAIQQGGPADSRRYVAKNLQGGSDHHCEHNTHIIHKAHTRVALMFISAYKCDMKTSTDKDSI